MSWLFSRALVEESSAGICLDGAQSALWSTTPTPPASWLPARTTGACRLSRSGMTFAPLTDDHGEVLLTWCLEDSRVRTFPAQDEVLESTVIAADCGAKWPASLARYDRATRSWRTHQCLLGEDLTECLATFPKWGMTRSGELYPQPTPVRLICAREFGSSERWPTPTVACGGSTLPEGTTPTGMTPEGSKRQVRLQGYVNNVQRGKWPTPRATDGSNGGSNQRGTKGDLMLPSAAMRVPTPKARDGKGCTQRGAHAPGDALPNTAGPDGQPIGGRLNPTWVEWLMGWPLGWTNCGASATARYRQWQHSHGVCCAQEVAND